MNQQPYQPAPQGNNVPAVGMSAESLDLIVSLEASADYIKLTELGYLGPGGLAHEFVARILDHTAYWVKWEGNTPHKIPVVAGQPQPEGYELKVDLKLQLENGNEYTLSLPKTSVTFQYSPYVGQLRKQGMTPADVLTRFSCELRSHNGRTWAQAKFAAVQRLQEPRTVNATRNDPPQAPPQAAHSQTPPPPQAPPMQAQEQAPPAGHPANTNEGPAPSDTPPPSGPASETPAGW